MRNWSPALVVLSLLWTAPAVRAADEIDQAPGFQLEPRDNDLAVLIGIANYRDVEAKSQYSDDDARLMKQYLLSLGFRESRIQLMVNDRATRSDFVKNLERWLPQQVKPDSRVFIYYSGHGSPDVTKEKPEAYLLPYDGDPSDLVNTGYSRNHLIERLGKLPAKQVIVMLDSCFSGTKGRTVIAAGARPLLNQIVPVGAMAPNIALLTASQAHQASTSDPSKGHGVLTYQFLKALRDGSTGLGEIYRKIKPRVEDEAKSLNFDQTPALTSGDPRAPEKFQLADPEAIKAAREKIAKEAEAARLKAEQERKERDNDASLVAERQRLADEQRRLKEQREAADRDLRERQDRLEREARQREAQRQWETDQERQRLRNSRQTEEPVFVPPTF